jgi:glycosyltransferase involved in cell wall biosynthesis
MSGVCSFAPVSGVNLESSLPERFPADAATALFCSGTADDRGRPVRALELVVNGAAHALDAVRMPRFDMACRRSGFWGVIPFRAPDTPGKVELRAVTERGAQALGSIEIVAAPASVRCSRPGLIAICMGTFDPDPDLLRTQLESLRGQTDTNWTCVISDDHSDPERYAQLERLVGGDERFSISRAERQVGFYNNFERALRLAPPAAELIALCDQDDVWHPDKLAVLRAALGSAALVYSDLRLVEPSGRVLRDTLWRGRRNNFTNMASLLLANTVTGAAALFRREVAELALPFPDTPGIDFHDHWIALVALARGQLRYVEAPLYDYVQHKQAVLGKVAGEARARRRPRAPRVRSWRAAYFVGFVPGRIRALTLLLRCAATLTPAKRRALEWYLATESSPLALGWLVLRPLLALLGRTETLASEWELVPGLVWRRVAALTASRWWPRRLALDTRLPNAHEFEYRRQRRWRART